jgi:hypothetical protein
MIPNPLHAAVVHFPVVFAMLLPLVAVATLVAIRRDGGVRRWWGITLAVMFALAVSSYAAIRTGEAEEDRVERAVGEQPLHTHEEAAERFLVLTGALLALGGLGLLPARVGGTFRLLGTIATAGVMLAGWQVGHTGGELVYRHGAASAYSSVARTADAAQRAAETDRWRRSGDD